MNYYCYHHQQQQQQQRRRQHHRRRLIRVITSGRMRWAEHVARMEKKERKKEMRYFGWKT
jgi:hypothetical protein